MIRRSGKFFVYKVIRFGSVFSLGEFHSQSLTTCGVARLLNLSRPPPATPQIPMQLPQVYYSTGVLPDPR